MKILELNLLAFGPFTGVRLDLSDGSAGLHIIYGDNEAGKSSSLRAIRALLYGIPNNTSDNFLHDNQALRIGGRLRHSNGNEVSFLRRKGTKKTLLSPDDKPLDDGILEKFLGGIGETVFTTMFGISHEALVSGGRDIILGGGEVGQSLFAAGLGTSGLPALRKELEDEMRALFLPSGSKPAINSAIDDYRRIKKQVVELSLPSREWTEHDRALQEALDQQARVAERLAKLSAEKLRLERIAKALPKIGRRAELLKRLEEMGQVVLLSPEFSAERQDAVSSLQAAVIGYNRAQTELEGLKEEVNKLKIPQPLLNQGKTITALYKKLGAHLKAQQDLPGLKGGLRELETKAAAQLAKLRPDLNLSEVEEIRLTTAAQLTIRDLVSQHQAIETSLAHAKKDMEKTEKDLETNKTALEELPVIRDPNELRLVINKAQKRGDLEGRWDELDKAIEELKEQGEVNLSKLGLWSGTLQELETLPLPVGETIDRFESLLGDQEREVQDLTKAIAASQEEEGQLRKQITALRLAGEVPSETELSKAREDRNHGWQLIRKNWLNGEDISQDSAAYDPERELAEAYEIRMISADEIADRLRREAQRVAEQGSLVAALQAQEQKIEKLILEHEKSSQLLDQLQGEWREAWQPCSIEPLPPKEMRSWMNSQQQLAQKVEKLRALQTELEAVKGDIAACKASLGQALVKLAEPEPKESESLEVLLDRCRNVVAIIEGEEREKAILNEKRQQLKEIMAQAEQERKAAEGQLKQWQHAWIKAIKPLKLQDETSPAVANALLSAMEELFRNVDKAASDRVRTSEIKLDAEKFRNEVQKMMGQVAPDLLELGPEQAVEELYARLTQAQQDKAKLESLEEQMEGKKEYIKATDGTVQTEKGRLEVLCRQAGCSDYHDLEDLEYSSSEYQKLQQDIASLEELILEQSAGGALEEFIRDAGTVDIDGIPGLIDQIDLDLKELNRNQEELREAIVAERVELERMDGNARAAEAADRAQEILAKMQVDVEHYVRLKLSSLILQREIERYREKNQGTIIRRAADIFASLTLGSFASLAVDYNEKDDKPFLQGVRPNGKRVGVEGMSDGTEDPLYLALRLATLEQYLKNQEPVPFIVDDILIRLDDNRAAAALKVLHDLSHLTQVIFFTHHQRLVELAQHLGNADGIFIHRLS